MTKKVLSRTVILLSLISMFTDMASEMLYPIMPMFLESIGFSVVGIGILEGIAQAVAGLSKGYFGKWSDTLARRTPFVQWGYFLSALSKPLMAVWTHPLWVLGARTTDRLGKGIRTGARDALLSAEATTATKATVFGFHRSMDTLGAAIGPGLALVFLWFYPESYRTLFFLAFFPGLFAVGVTLLLKDPVQPVRSNKKFPGLLAFLKYIPESSPAYRKLLYGLLAFALVNSSDLFLLLLLKGRGISDSVLIGFYIFYNLVYALAAYPVGKLADKWDLKPTFILGLLLFATVYGGMAFAHNWWWFGALFFLYGLYAAFTEGIAKAWISNICKAEDTATAIGTYDGLQSVATLLASTGAGLIWYYFGANWMFGLTAGLVVAIAFYFYFKVEHQS